MIVRDGGATVLLAITIAYFLSWGIEKMQPEQCWYEYQKSETETVYRWEDCKPGDKSD